MYDAHLVLERHPVLAPAAPVPPHVVAVHGDTVDRHKEQQRRVGPVARWVSYGGLVGLVNPHADNLARRAHGDVERNGKANGGGRVQVRRQPAEKRRNARKGARRGDDEAVVPLLLLSVDAQGA